MASSPARSRRGSLSWRTVAEGEAAAVSREGKARRPLHSEFTHRHDMLTCRVRGELCHPRGHRCQCPSSWQLRHLSQQPTQPCHQATPGRRLLVPVGVVPRVVCRNCWSAPGSAIVPAHRCHQLGALLGGWALLAHCPIRVQCSLHATGPRRASSQRRDHLRL